MAPEKLSFFDVAAHRLGDPWLQSDDTGLRCGSARLTVGRTSKSVED